MNTASGVMQHMDMDICMHMHMHMWLQPPTHLYGCSLECVCSQVRLWVWLCLQSSSTNCVYMYFVIPRYLAIREAQAPCHAAAPAPALRPHQPCNRSAPAPTMQPPCARTNPATALRPRAPLPLRPCHPCPTPAPCHPCHPCLPAAYPLLPTQAYDAAAFDRWGEVLAARAVLLASTC